MQELAEINQLFQGWAIPLAASLGSLCAMLLLKRLILVRAARHTSSSNLQVFLRSLSFPLTLVIIVCNLFLLGTLLDRLASSAGDVVVVNSVIARLLLIAAVIILADRFGTGLLNNYAGKSEAVRNSTGVARGIIHILVYGIGLLVILGTLGVSITPLVASLGITSLAVALALQPTLENFFSGLQLVLDKPIRVGDYIELDSGEQGFVEKIGWRSTWIKMLPNNMVIMPNSKLSDSKVINYFYPARELSVPVDVGVHYDSDLEHVEKVTLEVAREIMHTHEWGVPEYEPLVFFTTFDNSSINFTVMIRTREYFNRFWVKSAFMKALHRRFKEEGIRIPFPITALNLDQEGAEEVLKKQPASDPSLRQIG